MIKNHYSIFAVVTILVLGSTFFFSQTHAEMESEGVYVTKKFTSISEPGFVSASLLICAGNEPLAYPEIVVTSDVDSKILTLNGNVKENICRGETVLIETTNLSSIKAELISHSELLFIDGFPSASKQELANPGVGVKNVITIPYWFSDTMSWYLDGVVSEKELTSAMKYLLDERIIFHA